MKYSDLLTYVKAGLTGYGYGSTNPDVGEQLRTMPVFNPGPATSPSLAKLSSGSTVFLTLGNGAGLSTEQLFDRPFIAVRAIGPQNDYNKAEKLAYDIDRLLLKVGSNTTIGSAKVLYITRTGGSPQLIDFDSANRHHFLTTYITEAQTGY